MRMISAIELKKYIVGISIFSVIISNLYYKKKLCPIILLKIDKNSEVGFYYTILPLSLAIYLYIKGGEKFLFDIKKIT